MNSIFLLDDKLCISLITEYGSHMSRHIREAILDMISIIYKAYVIGIQGDDRALCMDSKVEESIVMLDECSLSVICTGLQDNWSQVRLVATNAARNYCARFAGCEITQDRLQNLLPRLCLNRFYVADGVKIASQETWVSIVGQKGKSMLSKVPEQAISYYTEMSY